VIGRVAREYDAANARTVCRAKHTPYIVGAPNVMQNQDWHAPVIPDLEELVLGQDTCPRHEQRKANKHNEKSGSFAKRKE
jgi:hypothetical protein